MMNKGNLALKYRPGTFDQLWGNQETVRALRTNLTKKDHSRTYMFSGAQGCGKTSTARILADVVGASEVIELNVADQRNIDDARAIIEEIKYPPVIGGKRVYILDEIHAANSTWEDAMLKSIEEPPEWEYFVLCTTDPKKVKKTLRSRCEHYIFEPLSPRVIVPKLSEIQDTIIQECSGSGNCPDALSMEQLTTISEITNGIPREALILLGKVLFAGVNDRAALLTPVEGDSATIDLCRALLNGASLGSVMGMLQNNRAEPESIRRAIIGYLSAVMMKSPGTANGNRAANLFGDFIEPLYDTGKPGLVYQVYVAMSRR